MKEKVIGKYTILDELGRGGMGVVYKGKHETLNRFAAIKVLPAQLAADELCLQRFMREADTLARLQHQNIVNIYDIETLNETQYLIMEYVNGLTLADILSSNGPFAPDEAAKIIRDVALALSHSHIKGIIHRDIKPANIMIDDDGIVKVADFGIARVMEDYSVTKTGVIGTPKYMSPERIKGEKDIDGRSDIYALGIVFYEMVTGEPPFSDENEFSILEKHIRTAPTPPSKVRSDLPKIYEKIILKCLEKNTNTRYPTCSELIASLEDALSKRATVAESAGTPDTTKVVSRGRKSKMKTVLHTKIPGLKHAKTSTTRLILLGVAIVIVIAIALPFLIGDSSDRLPSSGGDPDADSASELSPLFSAEKELNLRSFKAKNDELLTAIENHPGEITTADVKRWFRLKVGIKDKTTASSDVVAALSNLVGGLQQIARIEDDDCDILFTLSASDGGIRLTVQDNVYGDKALFAHQEVLDVGNQQDLLSKLKTILVRNYCFNALLASSALNPLNDEIGIKIETSGKTDRIFQLGDNINICMTPNSQRYCMLFNINLDGIYLLFPRFGKEEHLLKAGEIQCSGSIEVSPPTGNEMIFAIMSSEVQLLPLRDLYFDQSQVFHSWSYELSNPDNAVSFCEQLMRTLIDEPAEKWSTKSLFIKTLE